MHPFSHCLCNIMVEEGQQRADKHLSHHPLDTDEWHTTTTSTFCSIFIVCQVCVWVNVIVFGCPIFVGEM